MLIAATMAIGHYLAYVKVEYESVYYDLRNSAFDFEF